ncbi:MAG: hypothetical protein HY000_15135 [Planctomycetes bacterium]|nr:hypothetical protein [Planctomycetota bacterium]
MTMTAKIARVEALAVNYAVLGHFKFFAATANWPHGRPAVVVKITTEDGAIGWGQSVPSQRWSYETLESVTTTIRNYLGPALIGYDAFDVDAIHALMGRTIAPSFSTGQPICKAGIDLALWDLTGKLLKVMAGRLAAPSGAGLGVQVDEQKLQAHLLADVN